MTQCIPKTAHPDQVTLPFHPQLPVVVQADAPDMSSDAGWLLLRGLDDQLGLTSTLAELLPDTRDPNRVVHPRHEQLRQRVFQIALGYEDCNDADRLRCDPLLKTVCDREPNDAVDLSSQPTLSRFENAISGSRIGRLLRQLERQYVASLSPETELVVLDIDSTDDATHGQQQLSFFNGFFDHYVYHPLLVFDAETGQAVTAVLRPGNSHASRGARGLLRRLIRKIRRRCPFAQIVVRGDSAFSVPRIVKELEKLNNHWGEIYYLFGYAKNATLLRLIEPTMMEAKRRYEIWQEKRILFVGLRYKAKTWERTRQIIGKADYSREGANPRFVLTNIEDFPPEDLYTAYCERGNCENRIKDLKNALAADRLSCSSFQANFFRLLLHLMAYRLMHALREHVGQISATLGHAQFDTLRLKLLKVGALVRQSVRRILIRLPRAFPLQDVFLEAAQRLAAPS